MQPKEPLVFAIDSASRVTAVLFIDSVRIPCPHCGAEQSHVVVHGTAMTWWECPTCASVWPMAAIRTYGIAPKALAEYFRRVAAFTARELLEHPSDALKLITEPPSSPYDDAVVVRR
jgi:ribosomal protein L37AE/L43A